MMSGGHGGHHGQTLNDRLTAARYALAGQGLARVVCKATTEEMIAPKKKHIDYLLQCTHEPNVSIPQMANLLIERTQHSSWIVVFKALITVHHLMCYGNERFTQYLASSNFNFQLNNYLDKNAPKGYDMSIFIRRYARYINAKALSYRTVAFDFTKCKRGDEGQLRQMGIEKLLKTVPVLQNQIDALLEFDCNADDLNNGVINAAFLLLFKDLIRLFACYNDANITCLEKYFELTNKKLARETLELYKKFLIRMNKVGEFLKVAEAVGIDRGEIPDLTKAPSSLLEAMEQHLAAMEGRKPGTTSDKPPSDEVVAKKAIEEEEKFLNKLKEKHLQDKKVNNPFLASSKDQETTNKNQKNDMIDLLLDDKGQPQKQQDKNNDPFSLETNASAAAAANNPFADILSTLSINTGGTATAASSSGQSPGGGQSSSRKTSSNQSEFATSDGFAAAFGSSSNSNIDPGKSSLEGFDAFGDVLQPQNVSNMSTSSPVDLANNNSSFVPICSSNSATIINNNNLSSGLSSLSSGMATTMLQPHQSSSSTAAVAAANSAAGAAGGIVKGDLEATLASLAENLDINSLKGNYKRGQQFNPNLKGAMKTGGPGTPNTAAATNGTSTSNIGVLGLGGAGGGGSISPSSMMMRSPITMTTVGGGGGGQSMVGGVAAAGGNGWNTMNMMGHNSWSTTNPTLLSSVVGGMQPIMPMIGPMSGQQPMMRHPSTLAGSVPILPPNVNASTLSTILSGKSLNNNNNNNNNSTANSSNKAANNSSTTTTTTITANNSQSIDPFGAL